MIAQKIFSLIFFKMFLDNLTTFITDDSSPSIKRKSELLPAILLPLVIPIPTSAGIISADLTSIMSPALSSSTETFLT